MEKKNIYLWHRLGKTLKKTYQQVCFGLITGVFLSSGTLLAQSQSDLVLNNVDGTTALIKGTTAVLNLNTGNQGSVNVTDAQVKFTIILMSETITTAEKSAH